MTPEELHGSCRRQRKEEGSIGFDWIWICWLLGTLLISSINQLWQNHRFYREDEEALEVCFGAPLEASLLSTAAEMQKNRRRKKSKQTHGVEEWKRFYV